jgi:hypothetical protein
MRDHPQDMEKELGDWNNGAGIDLAGWLNAEGNYRLAVGYTTVFWPKFKLLNGYIVPEGTSEESIAGFEQTTASDRRAVEWVLNHVHLIDIHYPDVPTGATPERFVWLGNTLREIYSAKLAWQFPDRPCEVEFLIPEDPNNLDAYQITFWQKAHAVPNPVSP